MKSELTLANAVPKLIELLRLELSEDKVIDRLPRPALVLYSWLLLGLRRVERPELTLFRPVQIVG